MRRVQINEVPNNLSISIKKLFNYLKTGITNIIIAFKSSNTQVNFFNLFCFIKFEHKNIVDTVISAHKLNTIPMVFVDKLLSTIHNS